MQTVHVMQLIGVVHGLVQTGDDLTFDLLCPAPKPEEGIEYHGRVAVTAKVASLANDRFMAEGEVVSVLVRIDPPNPAGEQEPVLHGLQIYYLTDGAWGVRGFRDSTFPQYS